MTPRRLDPLQVRVIVTDAEVLGALDPAAVAAYLSRKGWAQADERHNGAVWTREIDDQRATAVFLPSDPAYADYALRMSALLAALALVEDRSQLAILAELAGTGQHDATPGVDLIAAERRRQGGAEQRTPAHDDALIQGELIEAARCYAYAALVTEHNDLAAWFGLDAEGRIKLPESIHGRWPWSRRDWKPSDDPARNLTKAGALIAAEIDRLLRKAAREAQP